MSKMSNLDQILDEMITAGQKMIEAANALRDVFSSASEAEKPESEKIAKKDELKNEEKEYSFQEVRGIMATLAGKGKKAEAKTLLTKFNATRLSEVKEADYSALVAAAKEITNG